MGVLWWQWRCSRADEHQRLGVAALEEGDIVQALLHLRAAVRFDPYRLRRPETTDLYARGARLWLESADVRDGIRRREDAAREPGKWLFEVKSPYCTCYGPGHSTHWIPATRLYARTPRDEITVLRATEDGWLTFRDGKSIEHRWWHHDGARVVALWRASARFTRVRNTEFLVAEPINENGNPWLYCSSAPSPCSYAP